VTLKKNNFACGSESSHWYVWSIWPSGIGRRLDPETLPVGILWQAVWSIGRHPGRFSVVVASMTRLIKFPWSILVTWPNHRSQDPHLKEERLNIQGFTNFRKCRAQWRIKHFASHTRGVRCLILGEQQYFVWNAASQSTKWLDSKTLGEWPLATPMVTLWSLPLEMAVCACEIPNRNNPVYVDCTKF